MSSHDTWNPFRHNDKPIIKAEFITLTSFVDYTSHLNFQFSWLESYIPTKQLSTYLQLVAFSNYEDLDPKKLINLQLRDLHFILALWDLELSLEDNNVSLEVLAKIDQYVCSLTSGFIKRGLISRFDVLRRKQEILQGYNLCYEKSIHFPPKQKLTPEQKEKIKGLLSISLNIN